MILCTEENRSKGPIFRKSGPIQALLAVLLVSGLLSSCQSLPFSPFSMEKGASFQLAGKWTIHYLRTAESILRLRGGPLEPDRIRKAEIQLKQTFYGEIMFTDENGWSLLYRVNGTTKKGSGTFEVIESQGRRMVLSVIEDSSTETERETLTIEFLDTDLILLSREGHSDLPALVFQRDAGGQP